MMNNTELYNAILAMFNNKGRLKIQTDANIIQQWQTHFRAELAQKKLPPEWADIGVLVDDPRVIMVRDLVEDEGKPGHYFGYVRLINRAYLNQRPGVAILPVWNGKVLLLEHFRHPTRKWHLECPRGFGEREQNTDETCRMELKQELGIKDVYQDIKTLESLGAYYNNTGLESAPVELFWAEIGSYSIPEEGEAIKRIIPVSLNDFEKMLADGTIDDGFTIALYTRAKLRGKI